MGKQTFNFSRQCARYFVIEKEETGRNRSKLDGRFNALKAAGENKLNFVF